MSDSHGDPAAHSRIMKSFERLFRLTEACKTDNRRKREKLREWRHMKKDIKKNVNDIPARYQQVQLHLARVMVDRLKQQVKHLDSAVEKRRITLNTNKAIRELKVDTEVKTAHDGNFITIKYTFNHPELPPDHLFGVVKPLIMKAVQEAFSKMNRSQQLIFQLRADGLYVAAPAPPVERGNWTKKRHIRSLVGLEEHMNQIKSEIIPKLTEDVGTQSSKHTYKQLSAFVIQLTRAKAVRGGVYVELPPWIRNKKACVNVKNMDNRCFIWSCLAALHPQDKNAERVIKYTEFESELNMTGIECPVAVKSVPKFEELNERLSVNVLGVEGNKVVPLYASVYRDRPTTINLLLYGRHYVWVKSIQRLLNSRADHFYEYCPNCLASFRSNDEVSRHREQGCDQLKPRLDVLPPQGKNVTSFHQWRFKQRVPYCIYADMEALLVQPDAPTIAHAVQHHEACGYCYLIVNEEGQEVAKRMYTGPDADKHFVHQLMEDGRWIVEEYEKNIPMTMTQADWRDYNRARECWLCKCKFTGDKIKVRDHNHATGRYRHALCQDCNLSFHNKHTKIPVVFHNGNKYDTHLFIRELVDAFAASDSARGSPDQSGGQSQTVGDKDQEKPLCLSFPRQVTTTSLFRQDVSISSIAAPI